MKSTIGIAWVLSALMFPAGAVAAPAGSRQSREVVRAITRGDCDAALQLANEGMRSNDAQTTRLPP